MSTMGISRVMCDVLDERHRQDKLWGPVTARKAPWMEVLVEEVGEVARTTLDNQGPIRTREELVQVAAVAIAWIEALDIVELQRQATIAGIREELEKHP